VSQGAPSEHVTPYDRMALSEAALVALLASREPHEGLVDYFGVKLHAELVRLARATQRPRARPGRRVYLLPGIMGSQIGFARGGQRPNDIVWLDPIDINFGRLTELKLPGDPKIVSLGAMSYTYLKLLLSLRKAGFDAVLLDYDWRRDLATLGKLLAERIAADGPIGGAAGPQHGRPRGARRAHACRRRQVSQLVMLGTPNHGSVEPCRRCAAPIPWCETGHARPRARRGIPRERSVFELSRCA
jgi:hypothetical protein